MRIFHDLGHHDGNGLSLFRDKFQMDESWRIHCWEPNPRSFGQWMIPEPNRVNLPCAAWVRNGSIEMAMEQTEWGSWDGWASSVMPAWSGCRVVDRRFHVPCLDFSSFLVSNSMPGDKIHIKMDIEGAEFVVLNRMLDILKPEHWERIESLHVEWHERFLPKQERYNPAPIAERLRSVTNLYEWH